MTEGYDFMLHLIVVLIKSALHPCILTFNSLSITLNHCFLVFLCLCLTIFVALSPIVSDLDDVKFHSSCIFVINSLLELVTKLSVQLICCLLAFSLFFLSSLHLNIRPLIGLIVFYSYSGFISSFLSALVGSIILTIKVRA